jgi:hypothetical protein
MGGCTSVAVPRAGAEGVNRCRLSLGIKCEK